jgi:hypothetical protein
MHRRSEPRRRARRGWKLPRSGLAGLVAAALLTLATAPSAEAACGAPGNNEIVEENCKPGSPASEWQVSGAGDTDIQGFATDISVAQGGTVQFKVKSNASYTLDIYRLGYYAGAGARNVATVGPVAAQGQPSCNEAASTGLVDCGNWAVSTSWSVPSNAVSGIYIAVPKQGGAPASHIVFVVRDDDGGSDLLFQTSDTTWQAYNAYGGNSLYTGSPDNRAYKVSYNRPFATRGSSPEDWVFNAEYPMVRWLERNGYDVSYSTGVDSDRLGAELREHKTFLSVGHDEYWSGTQRANVEAARDAGVNLAFFSGNEVFWKTRWENDHRTLVTYKETHANAKIDPDASWTGTWRDPRPFNPQGGRPENALTGTIFTVNAGSAALRVPAEDGKLRLWRGTDVASQLAGAVATLTNDTVGYEWDEDLDNGARPDGLVRLSSTTVDGVDKLQDYGTQYGPGTATHHLTLYRDTNGAGADALVFGAGTVQWSWGLDADHDRGNADADPWMQQATVNLFADMGVQPGSLQTGVAAAPSTDFAPPTVTITSPAGGTTVEPGASVTIQGTATDAGGRVGAVEVSVDDGVTWHPATGRESWSYTWTPDRGGQVTLRARAADDSANLGVASAGVAVTIGDGRTCPCSLFGTRAPVKTDANDGVPIEVGVRIRPDADGVITRLRYYKGSGWTGSRVGHLWTNAGTLLGTATFTGESASGWQEAALTPPVSVSANTTYVASYFSSDGSYAEDVGFFTSPFDAAPLHAPSGQNGVFMYSGGFPTQPSSDTNYWADVVFAPTDTTPPTVTSVAPADGSAGVDPHARVSAAFGEPVDAATVNAGTVRLRDASGTLVPAAVDYAAATRTATLTPTASLAAGSLYTATVTTGVKDAAGNPLAQTRAWSFTTASASPDPDPEPRPGSEPADKPRGTAGSGTATGGPASAVRLLSRVRVGPRRARVSGNGVFRLRVSCPQGGQRCRVTLRLRLAGRNVAGGMVTVSGGKSRSVRLKLNASARRALARKRSLRVIAVVTARDRAGNQATTRTGLRLVAEGAS